jgi:hypothetical protein
MSAKDYENTINDTVYLHFLLFPKPNIFSYVCQVQEPVSATFVQRDCATRCIFYLKFYNIK